MDYLKKIWRDPVFASVIATGITTLSSFIWAFVKSVTEEQSLGTILLSFLTYRIELYAVLLSFIMLIFAAAFLARHIRAKAFARFNNGVFSEMLHKKSYFRPADTNEIDDLYYDISDLFGKEELMPLQRFRDIHKKNPRSIWVVCVQEQGENGMTDKRIGFFEFFPITLNAKKQLEKGDKDGTSLQPGDITVPSAAKKNFYVGGVGMFNGNPPSFRALVLNAFYSFLYIVNMQKPLTVFTRPVTADGIRLVKRQRFKKIHSGKEELGSIWRLILPQATLHYEEVIP